MDYVRGATYVLGILIIISGLYFLISASNIIGVLLGMTGLVLGIVIIWKVRKSGKQEKRLKK
jgi:drug/metabolite transporter (DMT)-like permease